MFFYKFKSISGRIRSAFLFVISVLIFVIIFIGIFSININQKYSNILESVVKINNLQKSVEKNTFKIVRRLVIDRKNLYKNTLSFMDQVNQEVAFIEKTISDDDYNSKNILQGITGLLNTYFKNIKEISERDYESMVEITKKYSEIRKTDNFIEVQVKNFISAQLIYNEKLMKKVNVQYNYLLLLGFIVIVLVVLVTIFSSVRITNRISKILTKLVEKTTIIANGDLTGEDIHIESGDEFQTLAESFNNMAKELRTSISKREKTQDKLNKLNIDLENRVLKRTKELEIAKEKAYEAVEAKSLFLANMSHEIRTPMNGVLVACDLALDEKMNPKIKRYLEIIQTSGTALLGIINDILDFSKIDAGKLDLESKSFNIYKLIADITEMFYEKAFDNGISLYVDTDPGIPLSLIGDKLRIRQILTNLIGNAIKFTKENGKITIGVSLHKKTNKHIKLKFFVEDTGVGIKDENQKKLFNPFTQADLSTTRKFGGTGLGLTISKKLIELMDGKIAFKSTYGKGTKFYFDIKLTRENLAHEKYINLANDIKKDLHILLIDKNNDSRNILKNLFVSCKVDYKEIKTLVEANEIILNKDKMSKFNLILFDSKTLQEIDISIIESFQKKSKNSIPLVIIKNLREKLNKEIEDKIEAACVIRKPIIVSEFCENIGNIFNKHKSEEKQEISKNIKLDSYKKFLKGKNVLLAEDNITNQEIAKAILSKADINIDIANNGNEAIELLNNKNYDLVLMDMQMPEKDGYEATRDIRKNKKFKKLPIIAMTAHAMKGDEQKCIDAGMNDYVSKPINQETLFRIMYNLLQI